MDFMGISNILMSKYSYTQTCRPRFLGLQFEKGAQVFSFLYMRGPSKKFVCVMIFRLRVNKRLEHWYVLLFTLTVAIQCSRRNVYTRTGTTPRRVSGI